MMPPKVSTVEFELLTWVDDGAAANVKPIPSTKTTLE